MISIKNFTGEFPRTIPTLLAENAAQAATDCDFTEGALLGIRARLSQGGAFRSGIKSMFVYDGVVQNLYSWTRDADVVRGPMVNDAYGRFYWTDGSTFNVSIDQTGGGGGTGAEPTTTVKVGVPNPTVAMSLAGTDSFTIPGVAAVVFTAGVSGSDGSYTQVYGSLSNDISPTGASVTLSTPTTLKKGWAVTDSLLVTTPTTTAVTSTTDSFGTVTATGGVTITHAIVLKASLHDASGNELYAVTFGTDGKNTLTDALTGFSAQLIHTTNLLTLTITANTALLQNRAYTYTYVNAWGEESGPGPAFSLDATDGQTLNFTIPNPTAIGYKSVSYIRIYRTATGSSGTNYLFVAQVTLGSGSTAFADSVLTANLAESLPTMDYDCPPQALQGLCAMNNGILAAFSGNELYFMEPYLPYAYRPSTIKPLPFKIIGICPTDGGLYVTTTAMPFLITGVSPDSMADTKVQSVYAGVSKWAICNLGADVVYATNDGLMMLRGISASLNTSFQFFTRNVWRDKYAANLANMHLNVHDGNIIAWFDNGVAGFMIRFEESNLSFTKLADVIDAAFRYPVGDGLYVAYSGTVYSFNGGATNKAFAWQSKDFVVERPCNFGFLKLVGTGVVTIQLYADGALAPVAIVAGAPQTTKTVTLAGTDTDVFRLVPGFMASRYSIALTGAAGVTIKEAYLANSVEELNDG